MRVYINALAVFSFKDVQIRQRFDGVTVESILFERK